MENQQPPKDKSDIFSTWEHRLIRAFLLITTALTLLKLLIEEIISLVRRFWQ